VGCDVEGILTKKGKEHKKEKKKRRSKTSAPGCGSNGAVPVPIVGIYTAGLALRVPLGIRFYHPKPDRCRPWEHNTPYMGEPALGLG